MNRANDLLIELRNVLEEFEKQSILGDLRSRVIALTAVYNEISEIGKSLVTGGFQTSAHDRLLAYFLEYPQTVLSEKELAVVACNSKWAREVRELWVKFGWKIITGLTVSQMIAAEENSRSDFDLDQLAPKERVLIDTIQDRDAAYRWHLARKIRERPDGKRRRILEYLRESVGRQITGEELSYVARSTKWARSTRELRTGEGLPVVTRLSGNPKLPIGVYVLQDDRQFTPKDLAPGQSTKTSLS